MRMGKLAGLVQGAPGTKTRGGRAGVGTGVGGGVGLGEAVGAYEATATTRYGEGFGDCDGVGVADSWL
jgi:hypothetical protein